jgi:hypothetical protein
VLQQVLRDVVVHTDLPGVDDAHVHARLDGVVEEGGVDGLAHGFVAAEAEAHVAHATAHQGTGQVLLDPTHGLDVVDGVAVVLAHPRGHREDVRVDDDVVRREARLLREQVVARCAIWMRRS